MDGSERIVFILNRLRWPLRIPIKWLIFGIAVLVVCFPYPARLIRHVQRWRNPNALIEPDAPAIQPLIEELQPQLTAGLTPEEVLLAVQKYVCEKIRYEWDWNTWGMADYLPTVAEAVAMGREDCDGQAVVAASLLSHFGFEAELVTDFTHVWVKTEFGETMGPGERKTVVATEEGLEIQAGALAALPRALGVGLSVFPLARELIILGVLWLLLLRPKGGLVCSILGLAFLVVGFMLIRRSGLSFRPPLAWSLILGSVGMLGGFASLLVWARRNAINASRAAG